MHACPPARMGVQTEGKIGGGRRAQRARASGDRLFFTKCAEGDALSPREGSKPNGRDRRKAGSVHESPARRARIITSNDGIRRFLEVIRGCLENRKCSFFKTLSMGGTESLRRNRPRFIKEQNRNKSLREVSLNLLLFCAMKQRILLLTTR